MMNRELAWELVSKYVKSDSLRRHMLAVESAMISYARKFGEAEEVWGICGLLHDFDYEKYPDEHPSKGNEILKDEGVSEDVLEAIMGHAVYTGVARKSQLAKSLFAVDELCGFVMAVAHVRPEHLVGMKPKSVKKKLKDKRFAANVSREEIEQGIVQLGVDKDEHIGLVIEAMQRVSKELGF